MTDTEKTEEATVRCRTYSGLVYTKSKHKNMAQASNRFDEQQPDEPENSRRPLP